MWAVSAYAVVMKTCRKRGRRSICDSRLKISTGASAFTEIASHKAICVMHEPSVMRIAN
jgi:hypothetical protein